MCRTVVADDRAEAERFRCAIFRPRSGSRGWPRGWVGSSTGSICICTRLWRRRSWRNCLTMDPQSDAVREKSSWIQAAFLVGWALGGGALRSRRRSAGPQPGPDAYDSHLRDVHRASRSLRRTWWQLMIFRFLAALGIGGEWAVGASIAVGDVAGEMATLDGGGAAKWREPRRAAGDVGGIYPADVA